MFGCSTAWKISTKCSTTTRVPAARDNALTQRGASAGVPIPMVGVPAGTLDTYLARVVRAVNRLQSASSATTEQREVVRIVTPALHGRSIAEWPVVAFWNEDVSSHHVTVLGVGSVSFVVGVKWEL
jgi:hypothetical protein